MYLLSLKYEVWKTEDVNFEDPYEIKWLQKDLKIRSFNKLIKHIKKFNINWLFWSSTDVGPNDWLQSEPTKTDDGYQIYSLFIRNEDGKSLSSQEINRLDKLCMCSIHREY